MDDRVESSVLCCLHVWASVLNSPKERYSSTCRRWAHPVRDANVSWTLYALNLVFPNLYKSLYMILSMSVRGSKKKISVWNGRRSTDCESEDSEVHSQFLKDVQTLLGRVLHHFSWDIGRRQMEKLNPVKVVLWPGHVVFQPWNSAAMWKVERSTLLNLYLLSTT